VSQSQLVPSPLKGPPTSHDCLRGQLYGAGGADNKERKKEMRKRRGGGKERKRKEEKEERRVRARYLLVASTVL
jgi:hypothetical protein